jgi:membrane-bound ClpP family serine protease
MTGLALSVGQLYGLTFALPGTGPLGPLLPLGYGPFLFGFLLLDLLLLRSGALPRAVPLLLIAGAALNAADFATPEVRLTGVIAFGAGIAWLGLAVLAGTRRTPAPRDGLRESWAAAVSCRAGAR